MQINELKPRKAVNRAFLKSKPIRSEIEGFKHNLSDMLDAVNESESEEFHKNLVISFLKKTYFDPNYFINTKGRNDLVIHNGATSKSSVGVIVEAKKPTNKSEMVSRQRLNTKAFHELILYFLRERITHKNLEIKHLVATNLKEWFIFDSILFERLFAQNKTLVNQFKDFESGRLSDTKTEFFYKNIAEPFVATLNAEIEYTYINLDNYLKPLRNRDKKDDNSLIVLFKLLSPEHLLKLPFKNDSNNLDKRFYSELLHIMGLAEVKEGSKKLIDRNSPNQRYAGTLLEATFSQIEKHGKLNLFPNPSQFGSTHEERLFNLSLELCITWINRVLFLKLLEAQLLKYHKGDGSYAFLNLEKIKSYDDLNSLFFDVLAHNHSQRDADVKDAFQKVPYLNSSLFEPSEVEQIALLIGNLKDDKKIPLFEQTVLKDALGKKRKGEISTLEYLFEFLNAYDFSSEGSEEIQEDNKTLINASVLGLIFEKINGYKDGSFFTPGFITMQMCRESIRAAVVNKFNEIKNWNCSSISEIYDKIEDRNEANNIVNSIKVCDPAVGSGHFLVSALNEIIAIKSDLKILLDRQGLRLKEYQIEVVNDELIVTDDEGNLFDYIPGNIESQRVQETLFHEKQNIIENCLFGVDINVNSVKICSLRLWIELLKNAYYKSKNELETLPNIDINIKNGNSLISRFALNSDIKEAVKKSKQSIEKYRAAVNDYKNAKTKEQKRSVEQFIKQIKNNFETEIPLNDSRVKKLRKVSSELHEMSFQGQLFELSKKERTEWNKKFQKLSDDSKRLTAEIAEIKANKIFANAFEWRFEFPEVLDDEGNFIGFDVIIGNPPYGVSLSDSEKKHLKTAVFNSNETAILFIQRGRELLKPNGRQSYIIPKAFTYSSNYSEIRSLIKDELITIVDCHKPWQEVKLEACIFEIEKGKIAEHYKSFTVNSDRFIWLTNTSKSLIDEFEFILNGISDSEIELAKKIKDGNLFFGNISTNKRGTGVQNKLSERGSFQVIGGIDIERFKLKKSQRGFIENLAEIDDIGRIKDNSVLVQNIVSHITNPVGHIKIIAALPPDDNKKCVILDTINQFTFREDISAKFCCALLNSKLINWYVYNFIYAKAIRTMHFDNVITNRIPFPKAYLERKKSIDEKEIDITDSDIYDLFGLNVGEISLIESNFK